MTTGRATVEAARELQFPRAGKVIGYHLLAERIQLSFQFPRAGKVIVLTIALVIGAIAGFQFPRAGKVIEMVRVALFT